MIFRENNFRILILLFHDVASHKMKIPSSHIFAYLIEKRNNYRHTAKQQRTTMTKKKKIDNSLKNSIYQIGWSFDRFPLLLFTMQLFCDPTLLNYYYYEKNFHIRIRPQIVSDKYPSNPPSSFLATPSIDVRSPALNQNEFLKSNYFYNTPNAFCLDYFSLWNP